MLVTVMNKFVHAPYIKDSNIETISPILLALLVKS